MIPRRLQMWCEVKKGVTVEAANLAGVVRGLWPAKAPMAFRQSGFGFPIYGSALTEGKPVGMVIVAQSGGDLSLYHGKDAPATMHKVLMVARSGAGLLNPSALERLPSAPG